MATVVTDDSGLAARFAAGDPETIRVIYQRYGRLVYSVAYKILGDAGLAEDATQQTFLQAWRHRGVVPLDRADSSDPALATTPPSAEQISDVWEVRQALDKLPDHERELIRLQHYAELTHAEIADELALPLGTVKSRSFRAHRRLAGLLGHLSPKSSPSPPNDAEGPVYRQDEEGLSDE